MSQDAERPTIYAIIYCRVSSRKQKTEGSGLETQEHRCRAFAEERGYEVEAVFPDDVTAGGDFMKRPGMRSTLAYLDANKGKPYVVIFDDLKRFARDTLFHLKLRQALSARGATVECLNFRIEDTPEGKFIETVLAAQGELERSQGARQVAQKMRARLEGGFWVFHAPVGYRYVQATSGGGKVLVVDEDLAPVVREALEGFASGRFGSQAEVARFLEANPIFPERDKKSGSVRSMTVSRMLEKVLYAGYIQHHPWGITLREGRHEGLISFETFVTIQDILNGRRERRPAARKDSKEDFPLRGFVVCDCCGRRMTGGWSRGKYEYYAYYRCMTRGCVAKNKSVPAARMEEAFADIMQKAQPAAELIDLTKTLLHDAWNQRFFEAERGQDEVKKQLADIERTTQGLLDRIIEATSPSVIGLYEKRIEQLERDKVVLKERALKTELPQERFEDCMELAIGFVSNPWNSYQNGGFPQRLPVLKLAFAEPLRYGLNGAYGTPKFSFPFRCLSEKSGEEIEMVLRERIELSTSPLPRECSTTELPQPSALPVSCSGPARCSGLWTSPIRSSSFRPAPPAGAETWRRAAMLAGGLLAQSATGATPVRRGRAPADRAPAGSSVAGRDGVCVVRVAPGEGLRPRHMPPARWAAPRVPNPPHEDAGDRRSRRYSLDHPASFRRDLSSEPWGRAVAAGPIPEAALRRRNVRARCAPEGARPHGPRCAAGGRPARQPCPAQGPVARAGAGGRGDAARRAGAAPGQGLAAEPWTASSCAAAAP
jgi:site-specific DNA recombinase